MNIETNFYTEVCNAQEPLEEKVICEKYNKNYKKVRNCINTAMKIDMMSSNNSKEIFHNRIINELQKHHL